MKIVIRTFLICVVMSGLGLGLAPVSTLATNDVSVQSATPRPEECTVQPRDFSQLVVLAASPVPDAAPIDPSMMKPVDEETLHSISETVHQSIACTNANDPLAAFALFSDRYLARRFGGENADDLGHLSAALTRDLQPADEADWLALVSIESAGLLADGRVVATVTTENRATRFSDRMVFIKTGEGWLIDELISLDPPATPIATNTP